MLKFSVFNSGSFIASPSNIFKAKMIFVLNILFRFCENIMCTYLIAKMRHVSYRVRSKIISEILDEVFKDILSLINE